MRASCNHIQCGYVPYVNKESNILFIFIIHISLMCFFFQSLSYSVCQSQSQKCNQWFSLNYIQRRAIHRKWLFILIAVHSYTRTWYKKKIIQKKKYSHDGFLLKISPTHTLNIKRNRQFYFIFAFIYGNKTTTNLTIMTTITTATCNLSDFYLLKAFNFNSFSSYNHFSGNHLNSENGLFIVKSKIHH